MIVTVLWEDQRGQTRGFGPHELLVQCLADRLGQNPIEIKRRVNPSPKKGVSNLLKVLERDLLNLTGSGPVFAVIDRDKIHEHLDPRPTNCMTGIRNHILGKAQAECDVVFMIENIESLIDASCKAMGVEPLLKKPTPDERDRYCGQLVWNCTPSIRNRALDSCPSFARLVARVAKSIDGS